LQEGLVRLSTHIPSFAKAAREFAFWTQIKLHRTTASRISEAAGATAVAIETEAAEQLLHTHPLAPHGPDRVVLSVDGAYVPLVGGRWAEVRTLAIGEPSVRTSTEGQQEVHTTALSYFSRLTDSTTFGELATAEIHRRGVETASQVGAVVDGAEWCQTFLDLHAPLSVRILDFPHAASYVDAIAQTQGPDGPLCDAQRREQLLHDLKHAGGTDVLAELGEMVAAGQAAGESRSHLAYLEKRVEQMDYPAFQAQGWPIGSGSVESANKLVVEERMKGPGMHWAEANVNPMLALRNAMCSERWEEVWSEIETRQCQEERKRRQARQRQRQACARVEGSQPHAALAPARAAEPAAAPPATPAVRAEGARPAATHPWRRPWSIRRQRQIASTP
jgi:hypothetical protein